MSSYANNEHDPDSSSRHPRKSSLEEAIAEARALRRADDLESSQERLLALLDENPDDPLVLFEVGGSYDVMDEVELAIPYYRRALEAGLEGADRQECLVCLGSSLRLAGEVDEAVEVLEEAVEEFPQNNSGRAFLAIAYYSADQTDLAVSTLMALLLETTSDKDILGYAETLAYYIDNLDETLDD